jgi:hypothetical protein
VANIHHHQSQNLQTDQVMKTYDIQFLEIKLAERPFRLEEIYFEILDHVLCKYEASGMHDVETFWEAEKLNWSTWEIYKMRFKYQNLIIWQFFKTFLRTIISLNPKDLISIFSLFIIAFIITLVFHQNQPVMVGITIFLWAIIPISWQSWLYHTKDTIGEKSKTLINHGYRSAKRAALSQIVVINLFFWHLVFSLTRNHFLHGEYFGLIFQNKFNCTLVLFFLFVTLKSLHQVNQSQLKPFLYEAR